MDGRKRFPYLYDKDDEWSKREVFVLAKFIASGCKANGPTIKHLVSRRLLENHPFSSKPQKNFRLVCAGRGVDRPCGLRRLSLSVKKVLEKTFLPEALKAHATKASEAVEKHCLDGFRV